MKLWIWLLLGLCMVGVVHADLIISPNPASIQVNWYEPKTFQMSLRNTNPYPIYNLTFSNTTYFSFPSSINLGVNQSQVISYQVSTNALFNNVFISTVSYFYTVPFTPPPVIVDINITPNGFVSSTTTIMANDSIRWNNKLTQDVEVRDFGTGFTQINIPALQSATVNYNVVRNFTFYNSPLGYTGFLVVIPRTNTSYAHDSVLDKNVQFNLNSVLPPSTMQVNLLSANITVNNNGTYPEALIEIRNTDANLVIQNVQVTADRWVSNFTPNSFNLPANGIQRLLFNITPYVYKTNDTNRTQPIVLTVNSGNAGNITKTIDVFINYQNMDIVNIGGINYTIVWLDYNATITACEQHMDDTGFEKCRELRDRFAKNVTVIKEIEAQYRFSEGDINSIKGQLKTQGDVATRLENKMNLYLDKQSDIENKVDNASIRITNLEEYVSQSELDRNAKVRSQNIRFWIFVSLMIIITLIIIGLWIGENVKYYSAIEKAGQV
jgi:hypothetical protein